jgi:hypothetical protein
LATRKGCGPRWWPRLCSSISALRLAAFAALALAAIPASAAAQIYENIGIRAQGMGGAFVAVADDATTTWWNPAGLASGGYFSSIIEIDKVEDPASTRARALAVTVPSLGFSYYRLALSGMRAPTSTATPGASREDEGVLSEIGATVGQSLGAHLVLASTLKVVHAFDQTHGDLDAGAMVMAGHARFGLSVKNLTTPEFSSVDGPFEMPRQARAGFALKAGSAGRTALTIAVDGDLPKTPTAAGDERHLAIGGEATFTERLAIRAGFGTNTIGDPRRSASGGASLALRKGIFADGQITRGSDAVRNGWGFGLRVAF